MSNDSKLKELEEQVTRLMTEILALGRLDYIDNSYVGDYGQEPDYVASIVEKGDRWNKFIDSLLEAK